jgi:general L-amino acid transport system substrate-binding protein
MIGNHAMRALLLGIPLALGLGFGAAAQTLEAVKARGTLHCAVAGGLPGFSAADSDGVMRGIDADICRAVAAATLGDAEKVEFIRTASPTDGLGAVERREADLLLRNTTLTAMREVGRGVSATAVYFYDGQGLLVRRETGAGRLNEMDGMRVCVASAAINRSAAILRDAAKRAGITLDLVEQPRNGVALFEAFRAGQCDAISTDAAALAALRATELPDPDGAVVLHERLTREPLAAWVRAGDERWRAVVTWTIHALVAAEDLGVASDTVEAALAGAGDEARMLLGLDPGPGRALGLDAAWAAQAIRQVGNYGEIFDRNLGAGSPIGLDRGLNDTWRRGGLLYAPPFR